MVREQEVGQKRALEEVEEDASAAGSLEATAHGAPRAHATRSEAAAAAAGFEQRQQAEGEGADEGPVEEGWQEAHPMEVTEKPCMHCGEMLPAAAFRGSKNKTDRLQNRCKVRQGGHPLGGALRCGGWTRLSWPHRTQTPDGWSAAGLRDCSGAGHEARQDRDPGG